MARKEYHEPPTREWALENYPPPWRVEWCQGTRRASIFDAADHQVISGMNLARAQIIVAAINRDSPGAFA